MDKLSNRDDGCLVSQQKSIYVASWAAPIGLCVSLAAVLVITLSIKPGTPREILTYTAWMAFLAAVLTVISLLMQMSCRTPSGREAGQWLGVHAASMIALLAGMALLMDWFDIVVGM